MKSSSTRRVLKSVVGPALGATLGALVAGGCAKKEAQPAPTSTQTDAAAEATPPPPPSPPDAAAAAPTPVEPEKAATPDAAPPAKEEKKKPAKKGAKAPAPGGAEPKKDETKKSPSTEWYAGTMLERDIRPMRPARRGTDATISALLTGLHDPALRPLT
jgi:type IV secretory pathway VirB10-like protein